jgi:hypothetical protein
MSTKPFELFSYQIPLVEDAVEALRRGEREVLIAATPGAGKTVMAFEIVRRLVDSGHINQALVLAWLRTNLKDQWLAEMEEKAPGLSKHVRVEIPQQGHNISGKYDLLVQDEGHQAYDVQRQDGRDGMVKEIKTKVRAKQTLILTGSPSTFIKRKLKPTVVFSMEELHAAGRASDLTIEIGTSAYNILEEEFNQDGDLTQKGRRKQTQKTTDETLESLLDGLHKRLLLSHRDMTSAWNRIQLKGAKRNKWWAKILVGLKKTVIACNDIDQAKQVTTYFKAQGVETLLSHSKEDKKSENIDAFAESAAPLLVVVDRAQLGYDNPELVNFIDMTGSRNPDRIFQMLCRVVRPSKKEPGLKKLFVKVMPASFSDQNLLFFMEGVLNLSRREIFETYDGTGFYRGPVPARPKKPRKPRGPGKPTDVEIAWSPVLEPGMSLYGPSGYFTAITHTNADGYEPIGQIKLCDAICVHIKDSYGRKERILQLFHETNEWPSYGARHLEVRAFANSFFQYVHGSGGSYDAAFSNKVRRLGWKSKASQAAEKKANVVSFFKAHGCLPSQISSNKAERQLGIFASKLVCQGRYTDAELIAQLREVGWLTPAERSEQKKECALAWCEKHGYRPSTASETKEERRLATAIGQFARTAAHSYDSAFARAVMKYPTRNEFRKAVRQDKIIKIWMATSMWPSRSSEDPEMAMLSTALQSYTRRDSKSYDPAFRAQCAKLDPERFGKD